MCAGVCPQPVESEKVITPNGQLSLLPFHLHDTGPHRVTIEDAYDEGILCLSPWQCPRDRKIHAKKHRRAGFAWQRKVNGNWMSTLLQDHPHIGRVILIPPAVTCTILKVREARSLTVSQGEAGFLKIQGTSPLSHSPFKEAEREDHPSCVF